MQLTQEQCDAQIAQIQQQIPELQAQLQRLLGYKQALVEMEKTETDEPTEEDQHCGTDRAGGGGGDGPDYPPDILQYLSGATEKIKVQRGPHDNTDTGFVVRVYTGETEGVATLATSRTQRTLRLRPGQEPGAVQFKGLRQDDTG